LAKIIVTGSQGLLGKEACKFLGKKHTILKLDLKLGHDLSDEKFVKQWFKKNKGDYLLNCFALNDHIDNSRKKQTLFNFPLESFQKYLDINVITLFSVCREFTKNNKSGSIINFSSTYGIVSPIPDLYDGSHKDIAYCVSKAGVINLTKYLAVHLAPNFRINCIVPGGVLFNQQKDFIKKYSSITPMKRMMKKNELNGLLDYLCSNSSSYMTGSILILDGGYTAW
jgi:NAD(P)-dependent dehydrogenase (short-subunit alcohol dehydrogenase family)